MSRHKRKNCGQASLACISFKYLEKIVKRRVYKHPAIQSCLRSKTWIHSPKGMPKESAILVLQTQPIRIWTGASRLSRQGRASEIFQWTRQTIKALSAEGIREDTEYEISRFPCHGAVASSFRPQIIVQERQVIPKESSFAASHRYFAGIPGPFVLFKRLPPKWTRNIVLRPDRPTCIMKWNSQKRKIGRLGRWHLTNGKKG